MKKRVLIALPIFLMLYLSVHIWFFAQPVGEAEGYGREVMEANVAGLRVFPALQTYHLDHIDGRDEILEGKDIDAPFLKDRVEIAVERKHPVTFNEKELNAWLRKRIEVKQAGLFAPLLKARGIWVDLKEDQVEFIIERELQGRIHVTSMFMQFTRTKNGYSIRRNSSHIGQVRVPGGFTRLIMPAFSNLADELEEELESYKDKKILDIHVQEGKITFDPRRPDQRL